MRRAYVILGVAVAAIGVLLFLAHRAARTPEAHAKVRIAASFYPMYFFAQAVGGDRVEATNLTPAGAEPHDYEPTPQDVARIESSDMLILNGAHLEPWADNILALLRGSHTDVLIAAAGLTNGAGQDPHIWLSPQLAKDIVRRVTGELVKLDPAGQDHYQQNATQLIGRLDQLDKDYRDGLKSCATKQFVTSHAAFGYLASAYGLTQVPIAGLSPDAEPSSQELARVAAIVRAQHIEYIFFESLASPKISDTLARETGAKTLVLDPLEGLSADQLAAGKDYFTQMEQNLANLKIALSCT